MAGRWADSHFRQRSPLLSVYRAPRRRRPTSPLHHAPATNHGPSPGAAQLYSSTTPGPLTFARAFTPLLAKPFQYSLWVFWVIMAVSHAFDYYQKYHDRELRASELEKSLAQARLQALQSQLNP